MLRLFRAHVVKYRQKKFQPTNRRLNMMTGVQTCTPPRHQSSQVLYDLFGMSIICINDAAIEQRSQNGQHEDHFHVTDAEVSHSFQLLVTWYGIESKNSQECEEKWMNLRKSVWSVGCQKKKKEAKNDCTIHAGTAVVFWMTWNNNVVWVEYLAMKFWQRCLFCCQPKTKRCTLQACESMRANNPCSVQ